MKVIIKSNQHISATKHIQQRQQITKVLCCNTKSYIVVVLDVHVPFLYVLSDSRLSG